MCVEQITCWKINPELSAAFVAVAAAGLTPMSGGDGTYETEAETHAGRVRTGGAPAGETLPDFRQISRAETGASIAHEDAGVIVRRGQFERDCAAVWRVSEGIVEQVRDGLIDALAVEEHEPRFRRLKRELQAPFIRSGLVEVVQIGQ